MNKVVTISLNGNSYQLEESGYEALRAYLDAARAKLESNPDREEILRDLEQAIADKLRTSMGTYRSVANEDDVQKVLAEMGPVDAAGSEEAAHDEPSQGAKGPKRLYRLTEGKVIFGVCAGLAAYFDLDVTLVRVIFIALTIGTSGGFILAYILMTVFIPKADTPAERLAAYGGIPVTARDLIDRAKREYRAWDTHALRRERKEWKRRWKQEMRAQKHAWKYSHRPSVIGQLFQVAFIVAILWAAYTYIPGTRPAFNYVGNDIQEGWAWLNTKVAQ